MTEKPTNTKLLQQATSHFANGDFPAAGKLATTVYFDEPTNPNALFILGMVAHKAGNNKLAIQLIENSLKEKPDQANVLFHLSGVLQSSGRIADAEIRLAQALKIKPNMVEAHINLGNICFGKGDHSQALTHYAEAVKSEPTNGMAHYNIAIISQKYGNHEMALEHLEHALKDKPEAASFHMAKSFSLLMTEQFIEGWKEYEWRWKMPTNSPRICPVPRWNGEVMEGGKRLYLYTEQGFGDAIMAARYIHLVQASEAYVILECKPELLELFLESNIADMVVAREKDDDSPPDFAYDYHLPLMSLPAFYTDSLGSIPQNIPYLKPKPSDATKWRHRLKDGKELKVGICWSGNPEAAANKGRACSFADMLPITKIPGIKFFSMQKGSPASELDTANIEQNVVDLDPVLTDFAQSAACLCNMDLLISTDTAIVHLAGAINTECWVMLHTASEWRWLMNRDDSPWYPNTTLFRQDRPDNWEGVVAKVCLALIEKVKNR
ncbi:MAG: tetratricopeptide repeat protein [Magnetococcales bacterium]|nr:tetratricopeptide repeat protein [Magnetococcales bacterium]